MKKSLFAILLLSFVLVGYGRGVEQYIPIGQSPGVSGKLSKEGKLKSVEAFVEGPRIDDPTVVYVQLEGKEGFVAMPVSATIYIDNSACKKTNTVGTWADLVYGRYVEVYAKGGWIKVKGCSGEVRSSALVLSSEPAYTQKEFCTVEIFVEPKGWRFVSNSWCHDVAVVDDFTHLVLYGYGTIVKIPLPSGWGMNTFAIAYTFGENKARIAGEWKDVMVVEGELQ